MVPDLVRGAGYVKNNTVVIVETPMQREVRWRFAYADAMVAGSDAQANPSKKAPSPSAASAV